MSIERYDDLPNKPLVEAILEIKWGLPSKPDRAYPIIVGRLYERLKDTYPELEDLPLVQVPPDLTVHSARHRFRATANGWPLVQVGPGVVTLNDTEGYTWADFRRRAMDLHSSLLESHPYPDELAITGLMLQYIDAVELDDGNGGIQEFVESRLHVGVSVPALLFDGQQVASRPSDELVQLTYKSTRPPGQVQLRIGTGRLNNKPAAVWHTTITSANAQAAANWEDFPGWLDAAYGLADHWFFALVQGDLLEGFKKP